MVYIAIYPIAMLYSDRHVLYIDIFPIYTLYIDIYPIDMLDMDIDPIDMLDIDIDPIEMLDMDRSYKYLGLMFDEHLHYLA